MRFPSNCIVPFVLGRTSLFLAAAIWLSAVQVTAAMPNIVYILADDLGWNDVSYHGSEIETPRIDALVREGVELDRYYAFPLCSPTRAAFLTGRSPQRVGTNGPYGPRGHLPLDEHLLPQTMRDAGYQTFLTGKWHLGLDQLAAHPYRRGFDRTYGHLGPSIDYFTHVWMNGYDWHRDGEVLREEGYSTDLIADEAVRMIEERDTEKPMFLYVAFNAPHTPLQAPDEWIERYATAIADENRRVIAAMVSAMDAATGRILDAIDAAGIERNTILVWASDNGGATVWGSSNAPLRGGKGGPFEGGVRVPATIRWPGQIEPGRVFNGMITAMDWFPTLSSAAGFEPKNPQPFDGADMWPALQSGEAVEREPIMIGSTSGYALYHEGWKLVEANARRQEPGGVFLFRIEDDPREERDLREAEPEVAEDMLARLRAMPRHPDLASMEFDGPPRRRRPGGQRGDGPGRGQGGRAQRGGPQAPDESVESRPPWIEQAKGE